MTDQLTCPNCGGRMEYHERCVMDEAQHFYCLTANCGTSVSPARLTRERDAAMGALKRIKAMSAVAGYDFGDASIHNVARQTITAIETGAIHNDQR